jgi:50S ribosomal protein L16 3-hydroxylase
MPKTKPNVFDGQNISASEFFKTHWQRSPYLFTNTSLKLSCLPSIDSLFELAAQEDVQSRIVYSEDDIRYQAIYDEPDAWHDLQAYKPTLLVSDIEKWHPQSMEIMSWFPFIKSWRFDDLMMSFAPRGASVGAHTDHYDVFLIQVQGTRKWSFDDTPLDDFEMVEDSELAVIANYQPQRSVELKPGDVLYLPPEIPHHGISTSDDCITCSIGLRSPSDAELLTAVIEQHTDSLPAHKRFKDSVNHLTSDASIGHHEINYLRKQLTELSQMDDTALAELFGQMVTSYRVFEDFECAENKSTAEQNENFKKSPFAVFAFHHSTDESTLFVNGETYSTTASTAELICHQDVFKTQEIIQQSSNPTTDIQVFKELVELQHIIPTKTSSNM